MARRALVRTLGGVALLLAVGAAALGCRAAWPALWPAPAGWRGLAATGTDSLWVARDDGLWRLDAQGHRRVSLGWAQTGLASAPRALASGPDGLYALADGPAGAVSVLDGATGRLKRRLQAPSPPVAASALAVAADGRIAVLGEHGIRVVDAQGRLLTQGTPLAGQRISALWWDDNHLWISLPDRNALVPLNGDDLRPRGQIDLPRRRTEVPAVAHMARHPRHGIEAEAPLATLIRHGAQSHPGPSHLTHLWPDGMEREQDLPLSARPVALAWMNDRLVVADAAGHRLMQFDADRRALPDFGDDEVRSLLRWTSRWQGVLAWPPQAWGVACAVLASMALVLWRLGTPAASPTPAPAPAVGLMPTDRCEAWLNRRARARLAAWPADRPLLADGEQLREVFSLSGLHGLWWMVLTNRRLSQYRWTASGPELLRQCHRTEVHSVRLTLPAAGRPWQAAQVDILLNDGQALCGRIRPTGVARRVTAMLQIRPPSAGRS